MAWSSKLFFAILSTTGTEGRGKERWKGKEEEGGQPTCMQQLSMIMVSNLILGYSSATSSQHCRNSPSPSFLSTNQCVCSVKGAQSISLRAQLSYPQPHGPHMMLALWTAVTLLRPFLVA